jgi:hypothetical protein
MKVIEPVFEPVTIVIETEDELKALWGMSSISEHELGNRLEENGSNREIAKLGFDMWKAIDKACIERGLKKRCEDFKE